MTGCGQTIAFGVSHPDTWHPDLDWLEAELESREPPKLVYVVNPCNPTGIFIYACFFIESPQGTAH